VRRPSILAASRIYDGRGMASDARGKILHRIKATLKKRNDDGLFLHRLGADRKDLHALFVRSRE
jgi:hypothetical protein